MLRIWLKSLAIGVLRVALSRAQMVYSASQTGVLCVAFLELAGENLSTD